MEIVLEIHASTTAELQDLPVATSDGLRNLIGPSPMETFILSQRVRDSCASNKLGRVLELLSKPRHVDGVMRWPLLNLKVLEIGQDEWTEQERLVNMVRNRHADREPRETCEPPATLQSLRVETSQVNHSYWVAMKGIMGPGVVVYTDEGFYATLEFRTITIDTEGYSWEISKGEDDSN
ncbi:hypothetical protein FRB95_008230 [Tulasnella sp. JGI-2019a]|nr:hypothetical protein FRB95_008230 [Tulasnella sp. JGI-2019a]